MSLVQHPELLPYASPPGRLPAG